MITSVTLMWKDGYTKEVPYKGNLKGLRHENKRPIGFSLHEESKTQKYTWLNKSDADKLNAWLETLEAALEEPRKVWTWPEAPENDVSKMIDRDGIKFGPLTDKDR